MNAIIEYKYGDTIIKRRGYEGETHVEVERKKKPRKNALSFLAGPCKISKNLAYVALSLDFSSIRIEEDECDRWRTCEHCRITADQCQFHKFGIGSLQKNPFKTEIMNVEIQITEILKCTLDIRGFNSCKKNVRTSLDMRFITSFSTISSFHGVSMILTTNGMDSLSNLD